MIETVSITDHKPILPWTKKLNPIWWLQGPDGWDVPEYNTSKGETLPYLPNVKNVYLRRLVWFGFRNPLMNFVGFIIGVEDKNYTVTGTAPVLATTGRDTTPQQEGFRWAILHVNWWRHLPFISYYRKGVVEFYFGWRPASGGFGLKIVRG